VKALQFFDMADHGSLVNTDLAGYGGIGRRTVMGFLAQVPFDKTVDRKPIHANVRQILVNDTVFNLNDHQLKAGGFKSFRRTSPPTERENG
jgi:hypothetical protein